MADISKHRARGWRENKWHQQPLKYDALLTAEAMLLKIEENVRAILMTSGTPPVFLTRYLKKNKLGICRYLLKDRKGYYPRIELSELIVLSWYLKVPLQEILFGDLAESIKDSITITKEINSKKTAAKMLRNNKLSTEDTY